MNKYFDMKVDNNVAQISIYGEVSSYSDETSLKSFVNSLKELDDVSEINLNINSPGGEVFEGVAIYNVLKKHKAKVNVTIDGLAASIASVIAMAGDTVSIPSNAMLMIHNPLVGMWGNAEDLRREADVLDKVAVSIRQSYLSRNLSISENELIKLMANETWLTASEALEMGFVDNITHKKDIKNAISDRAKQMFNHVPEYLEGGKNVNTEEEKQEEPEEVTPQFVKEQFEMINDKLDKLLKEDDTETKETKREPAEPVNSLSKFFFSTKK